jgi:glycosyltransferase involved in cell wall biosynthesis
MTGAGEARSPQGTERQASPPLPRVLVFASSAEGYGADRVLRRSVAALIDDHAVTVVLPGKGPLRADLEQLGATVLVERDFVLRRHRCSPTGIPRLAARNAVVVARLLRHHRRQPFDLIVTNTLAVLTGAVLARLTRLPHLWHVHEIVNRPRWLGRVLAATVERTSDLIVACSDSARERLVADAPALATRARTILNSVDLPPVAGDARGSGPVHIGCIGRIHPGKGPGALLDAFARACADHPEIDGRLHLFGDVYPGNEALLDALRTRVTDLAIDDRVQFHGFVADPDEVYPRLQVVVAPSTTPESFSLVCAEAQAYGLPVVGPDAGGPREIVAPGESGILVDTGDPGSLAAALARLARDPSARERMGRAGRRRATELFRPARYHGEIRAAVADALSSRTVPAPHHGWVLRATLWFGVRNRRHKARVIKRHLRETGARTVLLVGSGGATQAHELVVERAIASDAIIVGVVDLWPHPTVTWPYAQGDGRALPFRDQSVDLVLSQAVIEHVGDRADQELLLAEQRRVGRQWLATTPNRWFPIEPHTGAVLRHWSSSWRAGRDEFTRLLSRSELRELTPDAAMRKGHWFSPTFMAAGPGQPVAPRAAATRPSDDRSGTTTTTGHSSGRTEAVPAAPSDSRDGWAPVPDRS